MEKIKKILKKETYTKTKLAIAVIISVIIASIYTFTRTEFVIDRIFLLSAILIFIFMHFIFKLDKMYNFIYKHRFKIAGIIFIIAVIFEYSGSSIGVYNELFQGESTDTYFKPVLGKYRSIRSDEWVVNTPIFVSQAIDEDSKFAYYNDNLRGTETDMVSIVAPPVLDILTLARPFNLGFIIFGASRGLSVLWAGKWIALMLVAFEFFMLITDKKKLISLCGMMLVVFSASTQWWNFTDVFLWGMLALILIDKFLKTQSIKTKILCAIGVFISMISYVFIMYPAWQIPFIFIYLALFISLCIKNRKIYKVKKKDIVIILLVILAVAGIGIRYLTMSQEALNATMNTDYPGNRFETGGDGAKVIFSYVYSFAFPYSNVENPCEFAGMISFYPLPMILAIIYIIRNKDRKKHLGFFIPLLILSIIYSIFTLFETNELFAKLTFLYMTPGRRLAMPLGFIQILLLIYTLSITKTDTKLMKDDIAKIVSIILSVIIMSIAINTAPANFLGSLRTYCCGLILVIFLYLILTMNNAKNKKILIIGLIGMALVTGTTVNPIQKGISVLTDKPLAKETQKIVKEDPENNLWITDNTIFYMPNYLLASGAKVLNSTNIYPNFNLYKTVLSEEDYNNKEIRQIYNRYAHVTMEITENENRVELIYQDSIRVKLTPEKVSELGIKYIVSTRDLNTFDTEKVDFEEIYNEQGVNIFKVNT